MNRLLDLLSGKGRCRPLRPAAGDIVAKYRSFQYLLGHNRDALQRLAHLEQTYFTGKIFGLAAVRTEYVAMLEAVYGMVHALEAMAGQEQPVLLAAVERLDNALIELFKPQRCPLGYPPAGHPVRRTAAGDDRTWSARRPPTWRSSATVSACRYRRGSRSRPTACQRFLDDNGLTAIIDERLARFAPESPEANDDISRTLQGLIRSAAVPQDLADAIMDAYRQLEAGTGTGQRVAMRSSAVGEDTEPTFAGQYETVLNVTREGLLAAYQRCWRASMHRKRSATGCSTGLMTATRPCALPRWRWSMRRRAAWSIRATRRSRRRRCSR
ncbi:MAG: PEP/pyruvate-binding domain-containing protein [Desulfobacterales bacterium]|nr:PEP/pyruvate-binding domain-containing protein [Desulfobacterales bacterium]